MPRAAKKDEEQPLKAVEDLPEAENEATEKAPDAVIIMKTVGPDGSINTDVAPLGDVQATEVQTLIELGLQSWRKKIGL